jgi:hypothetical protein
MPPIPAGPSLNNTSCKKLLVSLVATALTEPDLFGPSGLIDLMKLIGVGLGGGSTDPVLVFLMKDLVDELISQNAFESVPLVSPPRPLTFPPDGSGDGLDVLCWS